MRHGRHSAHRRHCATINKTIYMGIMLLMIFIASELFEPLVIVETIIMAIAITAITIPIAIVSF